MIDTRKFFWWELCKITIEQINPNKKKQSELNQKQTIWTQFDEMKSLHIEILLHFNDSNDRIV